MGLRIKATRQYDEGDPILVYANQHQTRRHANPENQKAISRIAGRARELGMTYGKYVALHGDEMPEYVPKRKRKKK